MKQPFANYRALADELVALAALNRAGGSVDALIALHDNPDLADYIDDNSPKVARYRRKRVVTALVAVLADYPGRHMEAPLRQSDAVIDVFVFAFADDPTTDPPRRELMARLRGQPELRAALYQMDDREFELLCGRVLELMGCDRVAVTRGTKDRGIDMLGRLPASAGEVAGARRMVLGALSIVLVGQAKRYGPDNPVGPNEVREIVGTWALILRARANGELEEHIADVLDDLGLRAEDPPVHLIITSARFTGPAYTEARSGGVVLIDGIQVAFALAHAGIALDQQEDGEWRGGADTLRAAVA